MEPLFDASEHLSNLEREKTQLFERLAEVAEKQKNLAREVYAIERQQKAALKGVEEHVAEEPLTHDDVSLWVASVFWQFARTAPGNPHSYAHCRWCNRAMFERVVKHIREHGYSQPYGGDDYIVYDVNDSFIWTMGSPLDETILVNRKPASLRPV